MLLGSAALDFAETVHRCQAKRPERCTDEAMVLGCMVGRFSGNIPQVPNLEKSEG